MSIVRKAACAVFILPLLGGCWPEGDLLMGSGSSSSSGNQAVAEFCAQQTHSADTFSGPPYPLGVTGSGSELHTINDGFEDVGIGADAIDHNVDPMYVYSGSGSAKLVDRVFNASFPEGDQHLLDQAQKVTFWIYSSDDEPAEYGIEFGGQIFQDISNESGTGFSGTGSSDFQLFTVEPHDWTQVSVDVAGRFGNCLSWLHIFKDASPGDAVEFYIDDIQFHLEP